MDNFFDNRNLLRLLLKWKWHLLIIALIAAIVSLIVSSPFIMKPRFKSTAFIYPSNIAPYSDESETEQMLQWLSSREVKDSVIKKHDLAKHYGISPKEKYYQSTLDYVYNKFVKIAKTQYESIEITVTDVDPLLAKDIVNSVIYFTNQKIRSTHRVKYQEVVNTMSRVLAQKDSEIDSTKAVYKKLSIAYGIYDVEGQSQEITRGQLRTVEGGGAGINTRDVQMLKEGMVQKGADLLYLSNRIKMLANEYSELALKYDQARFDIEKEFTFINVVTQPQVADKKSYPKRLMVMFYFVAGALLFSVLAIAVIEQRKHFTDSEAGEKSNAI